MNTIAKGAALAALAFATLAVASPLTLTTANAQTACTTVGTVTVCDPTAFHLGGTSASGADPVLLNESTEFKVIDNSGAAIAAPLWIYFAVPVGDIAPAVTFDDYNGGTQTAAPALTTVGTITLGNGSGQDFYSQVNSFCGCDKSINLTNVDAAESSIGQGNPTQFNVYLLTLNSADTGGNFTGFPSDPSGKDFEEVLGNFAAGTFIAPLAENGAGTDSVTVFDTSWTNAAFVNTSSLRSAPTPEPSTWAMVLLGFAGLGYAGYRRRRAAISIV